MRPVSERFLRTIRGSHAMAARATVCTTFQTGTQPTGTTIPILSGSVTVDGTADIRSTLDMSTDGTGMWPDEVGDLLAPYGNEIFIERGVKYGNGTTEWCSLGYLRIDSPQQDDPPDGPIRINAKDRMAGIVDGRLITPAQFMSTDTFGDVVTALVTEVYPGATIEWDDSTDTDTIGRTLVAEDNRYGFLNDLVTSVGKIWYWDYRGVLVIRDVPDPTVSVFDVDAGQNGVLISSSRQLTREGVYNAVVAQGEAPDTNVPVRAVAYDSNPNSPTYFYGQFGPVPRYYSSPFITTSGQALSAASSILRQNLGLPYNIDFTAVPNPALEPFDPIRVRMAVRSGSQVHVLESLTVPLTQADALKGSCREQTTVLIGSL